MELPADPSKLPVLLHSDIADGDAVVIYDKSANELKRLNVVRIPYTFLIDVGDQSTDLTAATGKKFFRMPFAFELTDVKASVSTAPAGSTIIVDINKNGTTIMAATKLSIDASEKTSVTAADAAVLSTTTFAADDEVSIDIDQIGSGTAGKGLKLILTGYEIRA